LHFSLFRIPVRVHPVFWLVGLLLGLNVPTPVALAGWIVAVFVSILIHELGHAAVMRAYGHHPSITLYALGGFASYGPSAFGSRPPGGLVLIAICAAGPAAGFALAGILLFALTVAGFDTVVQVGLPFGLQIGVREIVWSAALSGFINQLFFINVIWGIVNLLPIYPLDGGQISREVLEKIHPAEGTRWSLMISFVTAGLLAVTALVQWQDTFTAVFFGYMAYVSYTTLAFYSSRGR
jgi:Zn-dependent protease